MRISSIKTSTYVYSICTIVLVFSIYFIGIHLYAKPTHQGVSENNVPSSSLVASLPVATNIVETQTAKYTINNIFNVVPIDPAGNKKVVLLTMDDGPKSKTTLDPILATLDAKNVHILFFVVGSYVKLHPDLTTAMQAHGHTIGNHTWDHANLTKLPIEKQIKELDDTSKIIKDTIGTLPQFFRPPYGMATAEAKEYVKENKMTYMTWSLGGEDWVKKYQSKDALAQHIVEQLHPGANILIHEFPWTRDALPEIIDGIRAAGYIIIDPKEIQTL
jgi:peptidoglycan/xylan/chitin deacetylase (PgdA/CDA1 family)